MTAFVSCSFPSLFHIWPEARIMAGMDASTITSLGTWRFVMPLLEFTMATSGRLWYAAWMSASISVALIGGKPLNGFQKTGEAVVHVDADFGEGRAMLVENIFEENPHGMAKDDRVGHLHHRCLQVKREKHALNAWRFRSLSPEKVQRSACS